MPIGADLSCAATAALSFFSFASDLRLLGRELFLMLIDGLLQFRPAFRRV